MNDLQHLASIVLEHAAGGEKSHLAFCMDCRNVYISSAEHNVEHRQHIDPSEIIYMTASPVL